MPPIRNRQSTRNSILLNLSHRIYTPPHWSLRRARESIRKTDNIAIIKNISKFNENFIYLKRNDLHRCYAHCMRSRKMKHTRVALNFISLDFFFYDWKVPPFISPHFLNYTGFFFVLLMRYHLEIVMNHIWNS